MFINNSNEFQSINQTMEVFTRNDSAEIVVVPNVELRWKNLCDNKAMLAQDRTTLIKSIDSNNR